jgi:ornithine cyclodeaminase
LAALSRLVKENNMRIITEAESAAVINHELAFQAARDALLAVVATSSTNFPVVMGHGSSREDRFSVKSASTELISGVKIGSYFPGNASKGLPRHNSLILLFDQDKGRIGTAIEAGQVNAYRTAAADAVAASLLAREDAATLAIFGAGHQAHYEVAALLRIRPIKRVLVVARDPGKAAPFIDGIRALGVEAAPAVAEVACEAADIIVAATPSRAPLFEASWVRGGTHIASMGSDGEGKQELPPELFAHASLFCDLPEQSRRLGEFQHAALNLPITPIGDVIAGHAVGRQSRDEITVFDSSGVSLQDLFIAQHIIAAVDGNSIA